MFKVNQLSLLASKFIETIPMRFVIDPSNIQSVPVPVFVNSFSTKLTFLEVTLVTPLVFGMELTGSLEKTILEHSVKRVKIRKPQLSLTSYAKLLLFFIIFHLPMILTPVGIANRGLKGVKFRIKRLHYADMVGLSSSLVVNLFRITANPVSFQLYTLGFYLHPPSA